MNKLIIFAICCLCMSVLSLDPPIFPQKYTVKFNETAKIGAISGSTTGNIYYDSTNNRQLVTRQNGRADRYCGTVYKLTNTACNHYVIDGKRYLDFPDKKYCCYCCDHTHGCGIVARDWLKTANATYKGTSKINGTTDPELYMLWDIKGLQENHYYHKNDSLNSPRRLVQGGDDTQDFFEYKEGIRDQSIFKLPSYCTDKCGLTTICVGLRNQLLQTQTQ